SCSNDKDCGVNGECEVTSDTADKQCFCAGGFFGDRCHKESAVIKSPSEFDESIYNVKEVEDNQIFWRIINDEIEVVLRYPGQSWVAIGWKPQNAECPHISPHYEISENVSTTEHSLQRIEVTKPTTVGTTSTSTTSGTVILSESTASTSTSTSTRPTSSASSEDCGPNEQWSTCPETSRDCEPSCDWTKFPETIPNCPRSCGAARCVCKEGFVRMTNDEDACVPFDFCDKESEPSCPTNSTWAKCGTACEPSCSNMYDTAPCPATCEKSACTCADNYVRHNGDCIYWGDCPVDVPMQTQTSSTTTPRPESLKCAVNETIVECGRVCEPDCVSIFSRSDCDQCGTPACACMQGYARNPQGVCVYWGDCPVDALGLQTKTTATIPTSAPKVHKSSKLKVGGDVCYGDFRYPTGCSDCDYKLSWNYIEETDEIEFSLETKLMANSWTGLGLSKDGSMVSGLQTKTTATIPTSAPKVHKSSKLKVGGDVCYGDFRYPTGCSDCDYKLSWNYIEETDEIEFSLETKLMANSWTGLGLSKDGSMVNADMMIIKSFGGNLTLHDMYSEGYGAPSEDSEQNLFTPNVIGTHSNGVLRAQFLRKRNTDDKHDKSFTDECWKMMFPVAGGKLDESGNITAHVVNPLISEKEVCIRSCREETKKDVGKCT
ncbi:hypothetical protein NECAME_14707, partial [Necator americanus]